MSNDPQWSQEDVDALCDALCSAYLGTLSPLRARGGSWVRDEHERALAQALRFAKFDQSSDRVKDQIQRLMRQNRGEDGE